MAREGWGGTQWLVVVGVPLLGMLAYAATRLTGGRQPQVRPASSSGARSTAPAGPPAELAPLIGSDRARREALDSYAPLPPLGDMPCSFRYEAPLPLGRVPIATASDDQLDRVLGPAPFESAARSALMIGGWRFDVAPADASGVGPIRRRIELDAWVDDAREWARPEVFPTLVVDSWEDPILPVRISDRGSRFVPGRVRGRVMLWSYPERRFVCGAAVSAENGPLTVVHQYGDPLHGPANATDDPMTKARIDLLLAAMADGASRLVVVREPPPSQPSP